MICERAVATVQGGRAFALQIATDAPAIRESIQRGTLEALDLQLDQHAETGCRSFEASLLELVAGGRVHEGQALRWVHDPEAFRAQHGARSRVLEKVIFRQLEASAEIAAFKNGEVDMADGRTLTK